MTDATAGPHAASVTVSRSMIERYAEASGDDNPLHLDDAAARSAGLDGVIAHGMLVLGLVVSVATEWFPRDGLIEGLTCRFARMVRPDDVLQIRGRWGAYEGTGRGLDLDVVNQDGEHVLTGCVVKVATNAAT